MKKEKAFLDVDKFYNGVGRSFEKNKKISKENKAAIKRFLSYLEAKGRSKRRIGKLLSNFNTVLTQFADKNLNLEEAELPDLMGIVSKIEESEYSEATRSDFKGLLKQLYKFFEIEKGREQAEKEGKPFYDKMATYPPKVMFFSTHIGRAKRKMPEELISRQEVEKMINASKNARDEAIISALYESGARIGEFGEIKIKHVKFDEYGVKLTLAKGKTGPRVIRLVESERFLRKWLDKHPEKHNSDSYLWVMVHPGKKAARMDYDSIRSVIVKKAARAGINTNKVNPHNFRHSRATELAKVLTEAQMCLYFGWVMGSRMPAVYVHLAMRDLDGTILNIHGITHGGKKNIEPVKCPFCYRENTAGSGYCSRCGRPLDTKTATELDDYQKWKDRLFHDPEFLHIIERMQREEK